MLLVMYLSVVFLEIINLIKLFKNYLNIDT